MRLVSCKAFVFLLSFSIISGCGPTQIDSDDIDLKDIDSVTVSENVEIKPPMEVATTKHTALRLFKIGGLVVINNISALEGDRSKLFLHFCQRPEELAANFLSILGGRYVESVHDYQFVAPEGPYGKITAPWSGPFEASATPAERESSFDLKETNEGCSLVPAENIPAITITKIKQINLKMGKRARKAVFKGYPYANDLRYLAQVSFEYQGRDVSGWSFMTMLPLKSEKDPGSEYDVVYLPFKDVYYQTKPYRHDEEMISGRYGYDLETAAWHFYSRQARGACAKISDIRSKAVHGDREWDPYQNGGKWRMAIYAFRYRCYSPYTGEEIMTMFIRTAKDTNSDYTLTDWRGVDHAKELWRESRY